MSDDKCKRCNRKFETREELINHMIGYHGDYLRVKELDNKLEEGGKMKTDKKDEIADKIIALLEAEGVDKNDYSKAISRAYHKAKGMKTKK